MSMERRRGMNFVGRLDEGPAAENRHDGEGYPFVAGLMSGSVPRDRAWHELAGLSPMFQAVAAPADRADLISANRSGRISWGDVRARNSSMNRRCRRRRRVGFRPKDGSDSPVRSTWNHDRSNGCGRDACRWG